MKNDPPPALISPLHSIAFSEPRFLCNVVLVTIALIKPYLINLPFSCQLTSTLPLLQILTPPFYNIVCFDEVLRFTRVRVLEPNLFEYVSHGGIGYFQVVFDQI